MHRARSTAIQSRRFLVIGLIALAGLASSCNNDSTLVASNRSESAAAVETDFALGSQCGTLYPGQSLGKFKSLLSCNGRFRLTLQGDGNLVVYDQNTALWSTVTGLLSLPQRPYGYGQAGKLATMQTDGNFVLSEGGKALWHTNTYGYDNSTLVMQDDGNLVIYHNGYPKWSSQVGNLVPGGCYRLGGTAFWENAHGHVCAVRAEHLQSLCGTKNFFSLPERANNGGDTFDGTCSDIGADADAVFLRSAFNQLLGVAPESEIERHRALLANGELTPSQMIINLVTSPTFRAQNAFALSRPDGFIWLLYTKLLRRPSTTNPCIPGASQAGVTCAEITGWFNLRVSQEILTLNFLGTQEFRNVQLDAANNPTRPGPLLLTRAYCGSEVRNNENGDASLHLNACFNMVRRDGLILMKPALYYVVNTLKFNAGMGGVTLATAGFQNVWDQPACSNSEADAALGRCAVFVASKYMVRGPILLSTGSKRLHFNYVALHGQVDVRRRAHFAAYFNPDGSANGAGAQNAYMTNCDDCQFRGFTSMYSVGGGASFIFNGQHASFRNSVFRDNGWGANRKGQSMNLFSLPSGRVVDIANQAHADGLAVEFSDYLNIDHCAFINNSDAHLAVFRAVGGNISSNYFYSGTLAPGQPQNYAYTAIDLEGGWKIDEKLTPPWPNAGHYGQPSSRVYLSIQGNTIDGGVGRGIGVGINVGTMLWYNSTRMEGGEIARNRIHSVRTGILINKANGTRILANNITGAGNQVTLPVAGNSAVRCETANVTIIDSTNIDYRRDAFWTSPSSTWPWPMCNVGQLFGL